MNQLNLVLIEGNLVREAVLKTLPGGTKVCVFVIAVNRYYKTEGGYENEVSYFRVEAWGKTAEACAEQGHKGRGVRITGRLRQERWEKDGVKRERVIILAEKAGFRPERPGGALPEEAAPACADDDLRDLYFD